MTNAPETNAAPQTALLPTLAQTGLAQPVLDLQQCIQVPIVITNGQPEHASLGQAMIQYDFVCKIDGTLAIWSGDHYELGEDAIYRKMFDYVENITGYKRKEVISYISYRAPEYEMAPSNLIAFKNGVLDIETMQLFEPSPGMLIPNVIPHNWNSEARSTELEEALDAWSCNDPSVRLNLEETMGVCISRTRSLRDAPILCGEGSNGKSTFLNFLRALVGNDNVSSLDLATVGARFQSVALIGKLVNIGDDISNEYIKGDKLAIVKKVISGDWIPAEYKGGATFQFRPYCRMVFSCNEFPRLGDHSNGIFSRLLPIPFEADFGSQSTQRNPMLERTLESEGVYEAAIVLGVRALKGCLERGGMTRGARQMETLEKVKRSNSSVYQFCCEELCYGEEGAIDILYMPTANLYDKYKVYCEECNLKSVARNPFTAEVCNLYRVVAGRKSIDGGQVRCFLPKAT